jgi:hypothetical protein
MSCSAIEDAFPHGMELPDTPRSYLDVLIAWPYLTCGKHALSVSDTYCNVVENGYVPGTGVYGPAGSLRHRVGIRVLKHVIYVPAQLAAT